MMRPAALVTALTLAVASAGCTAAAGPTATTPTRPTSSPTSAAAGTTSQTAAGASAASTVQPPTTTRTGWGTIWDRLPLAFPTYPGAEPAEVSEGPASAVLTVSAEPGLIAAFYEMMLRGAGYDIEALAGPMEDGSSTVDAVGQDPDCRVQVTAVPRGGLTLVTIMFAAACPFR